MQRLAQGLCASLRRASLLAAVGRRLAHRTPQGKGQASYGKASSAQASVDAADTTNAAAGTGTGAALVKLFAGWTLLYTAADTLALSAAVPPVGLVSAVSPAVECPWAAARRQLVPTSSSQSVRCSTCFCHPAGLCSGRHGPSTGAAAPLQRSAAGQLPAGLARAPLVGAAGTPAAAASSVRHGAACAHGSFYCILLLHSPGPRLRASKPGAGRGVPQVARKHSTPGGGATERRQAAPGY